MLAHACAVAAPQPWAGARHRAFVRQARLHGGGCSRYKRNAAGAKTQQHGACLHHTSMGPGQHARDTQRLALSRLGTRCMAVQPG